MGVRGVSVVGVELCNLAGVVVTLAILTPKVTGASVSGGSSSFEGGNLGVVAVAAIIGKAVLAGGGGSGGGRRGGGSSRRIASRRWACGGTTAQGVKIRHLQGGDAVLLGKRLEGLHIRAESGGGGGGGKKEALGHHVLAVVTDLFGQVCFMFECPCFPYTRAGCVVAGVFAL